MAAAGAGAEWPVGVEPVTTRLAARSEAAASELGLSVGTEAAGRGIMVGTDDAAEVRTGPMGSAVSWPTVVGRLRKGARRSIQRSAAH